MPRTLIPLRPNLGVLQIGIKSQVSYVLISLVTLYFVHSEAQILGVSRLRIPYEGGCRQFLGRHTSSEYVPDPIELEDHVPVYIIEPEHLEDLVPAKDEALIEPYITEVASAPTPPLPPPSLLPILIRPPHIKAAMAQRRATTPSIYHSLLPAGTSPLLSIPLPAPSTSRRADIPEAECHLEKRLLLYCSHWVEEAQEDRAAVRAEIEILRRERLAYEQESIETRQSLARAYRHEWQRQDADDRAIEHIIRTQALEAGARVDTLEDTAIMYSLLSITGTMATVNQGMSVEEIEQIVAQRVANAIEAIAIYESINQTKQQVNKVAENASNKRKWESDHNGS
ncbi:hypothetical protein Tco_0565235 [Tanacetum coccineum]